MVALGERAAPNGQELLAEFIQYGHQKPFEEIVRRYAGMVFNVCFRITKDKHEAEDAVQAVFLTLALQAKRGADIKALGPWLQQVAKRLALDIRRSKKRRKTREERHQAEQTVRRESLLDDALPSADMDELKTLLHEELQKLPAKYRLPLILHYFGGLTRDEMAAELNCKPSTLGVRIFRGREMLAGRLSGRGIHISGMALAALLGYAVKRAVSDSLIASTSRAATAMMAGHDGAGMASAHVIGLTRRATSAVALGKLKAAAVTLLLTGTSLGAGAKALQMLPVVNVQQILSNQIKRIIQPLLGPFHRPMLSESQTLPAQSVASAAQAPSYDYIPLAFTAKRAPLPADAAAKTRTIAVVPAPGLMVATGTAPRSALAASWAQRSVKPTVTAATATENPQVSSAANVADVDSTASATAVSASGGGGAMAAGGGGADAMTSRSSIGTSNQSRYFGVAISLNDLIVGSSGSSSLGQDPSHKSGSIAAPSPTATIMVPAISGTVTQTNTGMLRGFGIIQRTGVLVVNGQVVADGSGVDRTLNLTAFRAVETASSNAASGSIIATAAVGPRLATATPTSGKLAAAGSSALPPSGQSVDATAGTGVGGTTLTPGTIMPPSRGLYAVDHGRLTLSLQPSVTDASVLTWGDDRNSAMLTLTNSVRIKIMNDGVSAGASPDDPIPAQLALLAPDRTDLPNLSEITGATIGLWKVDSTAGQVGGADLSICYDNLLANALGASQDSVNLWTLNAPTDTWEQVNPNSFALDKQDHLVYGSAADFSYIAVSATPSPGTDIDFIRAHQLAIVNGGSGSIADRAGGPTGGAQNVPEPCAISLLVITAGLLGRRRRVVRVIS